MFDYGTLSDDNLYSLLQKGDTMAYTVIYHRYFEVLYIHTSNKLKDNDEAKDLIQEIFTGLWNSRETINITISLKSYLYVSVRNKVLDRIAHQQIMDRYANSLQSFIDEGECVTDHLIREKQLSKIIDEQINLLPEKMRIIFEMSRKGALSHREISEMLKISESTVKKQVANALKILRNKLGINFFLIFTFFIYSQHTS